MLKMHKRCAQNATLCSKCGNVVLKMHKSHAQICTNVMLKVHACSKPEASSWPLAILIRTLLSLLRSRGQYIQYDRTSEGTTDLDMFWPRVISICSQLERHYNTDDLSLAEQLVLRAEECTSVLRAIYGRVSEALPGSGILHDILFVIGELQNYCTHYSE